MIQRKSKDALLRVASQFPVVGITGPRQSGKTTLVQTIFPDKRYITFDDDNFETINGYLISKLEHIPDKKEKFEYNYKGYDFKVLSVENNIIKQILITKTKEVSKQTEPIKAEAEE